jgi:hypothetical protein
VVLAVWAACTAHCAIESLSASAEPACCDEDGGPSHQAPAAPGQCVCSAIQAGGYVSQDGALAIPLPVDCVVLLAVVPKPVDLATWSGSVEPASSPPGMSESWQFSFRAALPVRAPSLIS